MTHPVEDDEAADPVGVRLLRPGTVVTQPQGTPELDEELGTARCRAARRGQGSAGGRRLRSGRRPGRQCGRNSPPRVRSRGRGILPGERPAEMLQDARREERRRGRSATGKIRHAFTLHPAQEDASPEHCGDHPVSAPPGGPGIDGRGEGDAFVRA
jgi:hypothetical protein